MMKLTKSQIRLLQLLAAGKTLFRDQTRARMGDRHPCYRFNDLDRPIQSTTVECLLEGRLIYGYEEVDITELGRQLISSFDLRKTKKK